ncbi:MAG: hypothetical protein WA840_06965 [Caulobacteraceae bacterium]
MQPAEVRSGAMPEVGTENAQTNGSDFGGMPLKFMTRKAKPPKADPRIASATAPAPRP